jgi:hypothetical protein
MRSRTVGIALAAVLAAGAPPALADAEHAAPAPAGAAKHGMTDEEHAAHGNNAPAEHAVGGHSGRETERPVEAVLAGFAVVNLGVLVAAAVLRRRPASVKRRETLARVRAAAGGGVGS